MPENHLSTRPARSLPRPARSALALCTVVGALLLAGSGTASAAPEYLWRAGEFTRTSAPVYAAPVDGWWCHLFTLCAAPQRRLEDPTPAWYSAYSQQPVTVDCALGAYLKLAEPRPGWVLATDIRANRPVPCAAGDF